MIVVVAGTTINPTTARADDNDPPAAAAEPGATQRNGVPIDVGLITPIAFADTPWRYIPDPAPISTLASPVRVIIPGTGNVGDEAENILLAPGAKQAVVVSTKGGSGKSNRRVSYVCNYGTGVIDAVWEGIDEVPLCISRDGTRLLCQTTSTAGSKNELVLYEFNAGKAKPIVAWKPYSQDSSNEVEWATFVDRDKLLTMSKGKAIALWNISTLSPVWTGNAGDRAVVALSAGKNTLAVATDAGVKLINASDGRVVGVITTPLKNPKSLAFSADGKRLAACCGWLQDLILVWNLADGRTDREFSLVGHIYGNRLDWADDTHLLLDGAILVDIDRRVEIWRFTNVGETKNNFAVDSGRLWFLNKSIAQASTLGSLTIPPRQALAAVANFKPEQLLVFQPGNEVALEISGGEGDVNAAREALTKQLTDNEMRVVPESKTRLVGQIKVLPAQRVRVRNFGQIGQTNVTEHEFTPRQAILSLYVGDEMVWQRSSFFGPPGFVDLKEGESVDQALVRMTKADAMSLTNFDVPRYLARIPAEAFKPGP